VYWPKVGPEIFPCIRIYQFVAIGGNFIFGIPPGKVGVRLGETFFSQAVHQFGRVKASAKKMTSGCSLLISSM
jgi:hypothetical protein